MMECPKIYPIYREPCLSDFGTIFQKGTGSINKASRFKNDNDNINTWNACSR